MVRIADEIEKLIFYTFGRIESQIETIALRYGLPKGDIAERLSSLLSTPANGAILGRSHHVSAMPEEAGPRRATVEPVAVGELPPGDGMYHERTAPRVHRKAKGPSTREKSTGNAQLILAAMSQLTPPVRIRELAEKTRIPYGSIHNLIKKLGIKRDGLRVIWDSAFIASLTASLNSSSAQASGEPEPQSRRSYIKRPPVLQKGESTTMVMKFVKGKNLTQKEICQRMGKKYSAISPLVWNATITTLVRMGKLRKEPDGRITIPG